MYWSACASRLCTGRVYAVVCTQSVDLASFAMTITNPISCILYDKASYKTRGACVGRIEAVVCVAFQLYMIAIMIIIVIIIIITIFVLLNLFKKTCTFSIICHKLHSTGIWNPFFWNISTHLFYMFNTTVADDQQPWYWLSYLGYIAVSASASEGNMNFNLFQGKTNCFSADLHQQGLQFNLNCIQQQLGNKLHTFLWGI